MLVKQRSIDKGMAWSVDTQGLAHPRGLSEKLWTCSEGMEEGPRVQDRVFHMLECLLWWDQT